MLWSLSYSGWSTAGNESDVVVSGGESVCSPLAVQNDEDGIGREGEGEGRGGREGFTGGEAREALDGVGARLAIW